MKAMYEAWLLREVMVSIINEVDFVVEEQSAIERARRIWRRAELIEGGSDG